MNKSLLTNMACIFGLGLSFFLGDFGSYIFEGSLFGLSGALTNWLAVHMLFDKVPGLYGSGIIPLRFNEFKRGIKNLIMKQFFTEENIKSRLQGDKEFSLSTDDKNLIFTGITNAVMKSNLGGMLAMFGGEAALEGIRPHFDHEIDNVANDLKNRMTVNTIDLKNIEEVVDNRLNELTPQKVKEIIEEMIKEHLGWLVVWGGIFGFIIGVVKVVIRL